MKCAICDREISPNMIEVNQFGETWCELCTDVFWSEDDPGDDQAD